MSTSGAGTRSTWPLPWTPTDAQKLPEVPRGAEGSRAPRWAAALALLDELDAAAGRLAAAALLAVGFHQHQRGQWRRRRGAGVEAIGERSTMNKEVVTQSMTCEDKVVGHVQELLVRARAGDRAVLPELRRVLDADSSLWEQYGDLALQAQFGWIDLLAGDDLLLREAVMRKLKDMRGDLCGLNPSPLEVLLVERVLACYVQTAYADATYAGARGPESTAPLRQELLRRQESAQRRYLAAIRNLALVRKLLGLGLNPPGVPLTAQSAGVSLLQRFCARLGENMPKCL